MSWIRDEIWASTYFPHDHLLRRIADGWECEFCPFAMSEDLMPEAGSTPGTGRAFFEQGIGSATRTPPPHFGKAAAYQQAVRNMEAAGHGPGTPVFGADGRERARYWDER